ncbi:MAG: hypothetical protein ACT4QF_20860 [Sporichthyaceae bacterium]
MNKHAPLAVVASMSFAVGGCGGAGSTEEGERGGNPAPSPAAVTETAVGKSETPRASPEGEEATRDLSQVESCLENPDVTRISTRESPDDEPTVRVDTVLGRPGPNTASAVDRIRGAIFRCLDERTRAWRVQVRAATGEIIGSVRFELGPN